jgi:hypothetical protein
MRSVFISLRFPTLKNVHVKKKKRWWVVTVFVAPQDVKFVFKFGLQNCFDFDMPRVACNIDRDINKF